MKTDDKLEALCRTYKELNIAEKKKLERIAVRIFNTQKITEKSKSILPEENNEYNANHLKSSGSKMYMPLKLNFRGKV
jgi:hypothetical protein